MDDAAAAKLATDAFASLKSLQEDTSDIKDMLTLALNKQAEEEAASVAEAPAEETTETVEAPSYLSTAEMHTEMMQSLYVSNSLLVAILCAVLLSLGVSLYRCFAQFWRSK